MSKKLEPFKDFNAYCDAIGVYGHGGKRKGAGRKPRLVPRQALTIRLEPEDVQSFQRLCKSQGMSQSKMLTAWIREKKYDQ